MYTPRSNIHDNQNTTKLWCNNNNDINGGKSSFLFKCIIGATYIRASAWNPTPSVDKTSKLTLHCLPQKLLCILRMSQVCLHQETVCLHIMASLSHMGEMRLPPFVQTSSMAMDISFVHSSKPAWLWSLSGKLEQAIAVWWVWSVGYICFDVSTMLGHTAHSCSNSNCKTFGRESTEARWKKVIFVQAVLHWITFACSKRLRLCRR